MWIFYALSAAVAWGIAYALIEKLFQNGISPYTLLAFDVIVGASIYVPLAYHNHLKTDLFLLRKNPSNLWLLSAIAIITGLSNIFICLSIQGKNATMASIIELTYPIFTALFSWLLFKQMHFNGYVITGALLIIAGASFISYFSE
jgi:drug/metabolite transporter (DMT)-like permease